MNDNILKRKKNGIVGKGKLKKNLCFAAHYNNERNYF